MERRVVLQQDVGILLSGSVGGNTSGTKADVCSALVFKKKKKMSGQCTLPAICMAACEAGPTLMLHVLVDLVPNSIFLYSPRDLGNIAAAAYSNLSRVLSRPSCSHPFCPYRTLPQYREESNFDARCIRLILFTYLIDNLRSDYQDR